MFLFLQENYIIFLLIICSIISLSIFIERFILLYEFKKNNLLYLNSIFKKINNKSFVLNKHSFICLKNTFSSFVFQNISLSTLKKNESHNIGSIIDKYIYMEIPKLELRIPILATIVTIAPLLGLLGTILGIIDSFSSLELRESIINENEGFSKLLNGIWKALITTVTGLFVAILSLIAYNYLVFKINFLFYKIKINILTLIRNIYFMEVKKI